MSPQRAQPDVRALQSVRAILEGLILVALCWSAKQLTDTQAQLAVLQDNVLSIRAQLADIPGLAQRVTRNEVRIETLERDLHDRGMR
jgi:hypothetical protein